MIEFVGAVGIKWRSTRVFTFLCAFICCSSAAQPSQPARFELVQEHGDQAFMTVSLAENGLALIREKKLEGNARPWQLILLDTALHQTWTTDIPLDPRLKIVGFEYSNGELFYLFRQIESDFNDLHLVRIFLFSHSIQHLNVTPKVEFKLTHFIVAGNSAVLGGYVSHQPAILLHDLTSDHLKVVPGFFIDNTELLDLKANRNGTFNVLLIERGNRDSRKMLLKTLDQSGALLLEDAIDVDPDKSILAGTTSSLAHDELLLAGVWGTGVNANKQASGVFSVLVDPFNKQAIRYTDFGELDHFLDYLPPKRVKRIKDQADHRRESLKPPSFKVNVHVVKMEDMDKGFALLCELYIPTISTNYPYYSPFGTPYSSPYTSMYYPAYSPYYYNPMMMNRYYNSPYNPYGFQSRNTDVTMLSSSIIIFDHQGKVKEDYSFPLEEFKTPTLEQTTDFYISNRYVQFYKREKEILVSTQWEGGDVERDTLAIQLRSLTDKVSNEADDQGGARFWFGRFGYVWGYEKIKNRIDQPNDPVRYVYYVNKIKLE